MHTTIYLIRHSEPFKIHRGITLANEPVLQENEKSPLSINGEKMAEEWAKKAEFQNIDIVWSSNYVRAMSTAKYFAFNNSLKVNIDQRLNERIYGVTSYDDLPSDFEEHQFIDENYKLSNGESQKEVKSRMYLALLDLLKDYNGKRIIIVGHATATAFLLGKWCEICCTDSYKFNGKDFFDGRWNYLETFKLTFDENNNLLDIKNIR